MKSKLAEVLEEQGYQVTEYSDKMIAGEHVIPRNSANGVYRASVKLPKELRSLVIVYGVQ